MARQPKSRKSPQAWRFTAEVRHDWYSDDQLTEIIAAAGGLPKRSKSTWTIRERPGGKLSEGAQALPISIDRDGESEIWVASRREILTLDLNRAATIYSIDSEWQARPTRGELSKALRRIDRAAGELLRALGVAEAHEESTPSPAILMAMPPSMSPRVILAARAVREIQTAALLARAPKVNQAADTGPNSVGRPSDKAREGWFNWLRDIFQRVFDTKASWNPDKRSRQLATTPWIRFVIACAPPLGMVLTADQVRERSRTQFASKPRRRSKILAG